MRIDDYKINTIKQTVKKFDKDARIYLYGSMIDDTALGGDIDLLILSDKIDFKNKIYLRLKLKDRISNQKIDLLVKKSINTAFSRKAIEEGILL